MSDLVERARHGLLSRAEKDALADEMEHQQSFDRITDQLVAMSFIREPRYKRAVERYLIFPDRPGVAREALSTLCTYWDRTADYLDWLIMFIDGVEWDFANAVRDLAMFSAGYYLRDHHHRPLLERLIRIAEDASEDAEDRDSAGKALMRALGAPPTKVPRNLPPDDPRFRVAVDGARERLESE
jgi:hypothetical protein